MPYKQPSNQDTRGWRPDDTNGRHRVVEPGARTGENRTPIRITDYPDPPTQSRIPERGVPQDNMGNSVSNKGAEREYQYGLALKVDSAPTVPPSSYESVPIDGRGNTPDDVQLHDFEVRPPGRLKRPNSAVVDGASADLASGRVGGIGFDQRAGAQAVEPMTQEFRKTLFVGDGGNPQNIESSGDEDLHHRKGVAPEMQGSARKRQANHKWPDR